MQKGHVEAKKLITAGLSASVASVTGRPSKPLSEKAGNGRRSAAGAELGFGWDLDASHTLPAATASTTSVSPPTHRHALWGSLAHSPSVRRFTSPLMTPRLGRRFPASREAADPSERLNWWEDMLL